MGDVARSGKGIGAGGSSLECEVETGIRDMGRTHSNSHCRTPSAAPLLCRVCLYSLLPWSQFITYSIYSSVFRPQRASYPTIDSCQLSLLRRRRVSLIVVGASIHVTPLTCPKCHCTSVLYATRFPVIVQPSRLWKVAEFYTFFTMATTQVRLFTSCT